MQIARYYHETCLLSVSTIKNKTRGAARNNFALRACVYASARNSSWKRKTFISSAPCPARVINIFGLVPFSSIHTALSSCKRRRSGSNDSSRENLFPKSTRIRLFLLLLSPLLFLRVFYEHARARAYKRSLPRSWTFLAPFGYIKARV